MELNANLIRRIVYFFFVFAIVWNFGILNIFFFLFFCIVAALAGLYFYQNKLIYHPIVEGAAKISEQNPKGWRFPDERGMKFKDINIKSGDGVKLHGWFLYQETPHLHNTILYYHENALNIGYRMMLLEKFYKVLKANVVIVGYRGFGLSEGVPTEGGIKQDGYAILEFVFKDLREEIDVSNVFIFARSLGGAVGINTLSQLQAKFNVKGMILENTFTSMSDVCDHVFDFLYYIKFIVLANFWKSRDLIGTIEIPILFITGKKDQLVPCAQMESLFNSAERCSYKDFFLSGEGGHDNIWILEKEHYFNKLKDFILKFSSIKNEEFANQTLEQSECEMSEMDAAPSCNTDQIVE